MPIQHITHRTERRDTHVDFYALSLKAKGDFAGRFSNNNNNNQLIAAVISEREQTFFPALTVASVETVFSDGSLKSHPLI